MVDQPVGSGSDVAAFFQTSFPFLSDIGNRGLLLCVEFDEPLSSNVQAVFLDAAVSE